MSQPKWSSHRRREQSWGLLLLACVLAILAVVIGRWNGPSWLIVAFALLASVGGVLLTRMKEDAKAQDSLTELLNRSVMTVDGRSERLPMVGTTSLREWGVHEALETIPYLHRDVEGDLVRILESRAPALVLGPSMAGKTRMAVEVVQAHFPERSLVVPDVPDGLAQLMSGGKMPLQAVVWLNDLERYIADSKNFKGRWIEELNKAGNIVIATMRESAYEGFQPIGDLPRTQWELLCKFQTVRLLDNDDDERQRLAESSGDARIGAGISRYGVGAYVGGGFLAKERWESGRSQHPLGTALIRAAVDWRRSGIAETIPQEVAKSLAPVYLTKNQLEQEGEDIVSAINWATDKQMAGGALRLLAPVGDGWRPFDYLLDHISAQGGKVPDQTWAAVARADAPSGNLVTAGVTAYESGQAAVAMQLFTRGAELGDPGALSNLGVLLQYQGETKHAEKLYRLAVDQGDAGAMTYLGLVLAMRGETEQAEKLYRQAADLGDANAMNNLGALLHVRGETKQAEALWCQAVDLGDANAMNNLGIRLNRRWDTEQAVGLWRQAAELGHSGAMNNLAVILQDRGERTEAERLWRQAVDLGETNAMRNLGFVFAMRGETEQAEKLFAKIDLSSANAMRNLGFVLAMRSERKQAEKPSGAVSN